MKRSKKIHKLTDSGEYRFRLAGISSAENDYRLCWSLNQVLGIHLAKTANLEIFNKRLEGMQAFSQFDYFDEETLLLYRLISNRSTNGYLLEEMTNLDYLLQITGEMEDSGMETLVKKLNSLEGIILAFPIDPASLKSRKKLLQ
jgi:hypothetical protein